MHQPRWVLLLLISLCLLSPSESDGFCAFPPSSLLLPVRHSTESNQGDHPLDGSQVPAAGLLGSDCLSHVNSTRTSKLLKLRGGSSGSMQWEGAQDSEKSIFQVIEVPADRIGVLIGRAGSTIKELARLASCKIWVDPQTNVPGYPMRYVNLQGSARQVEEAKRLIQDRIENHGTASTDGVIRETVQVPDHCVGSVIGKGGSGIKNIIAMSGARVFIPGESPPGSTERTITISGYPAMVAHAKQLILGRIPPPEKFQQPSPPQQQQLEQAPPTPQQQYISPMAQAYGEQPNPYGYGMYGGMYPQVGAGEGAGEQQDFTQEWREFYDRVEQQQRNQHLGQQQQQPPPPQHQQQQHQQQQSYQNYGHAQGQLPFPQEQRGEPPK